MHAAHLLLLSLCIVDPRPCSDPTILKVFRSIEALLLLSKSPATKASTLFYTDAGKVQSSSLYVAVQGQGLHFRVWPLHALPNLLVVWGFRPAGRFTGCTIRFDPFNIIRQEDPRHYSFEHVAQNKGMRKNALQARARQPSAAVLAAAATAVVVSGRPTSGRSSRGGRGSGPASIFSGLTQVSTGWLTPPPFPPHHTTPHT